MTYAQHTEVPVERSRTELERTLQRYGAAAFRYGWNAEGAVIQFQAHEKLVRFELPLPARDERQFTHHSQGRRADAVSEKLWEQACRQRWRALNLVVKAKLEAVSSGITIFEDEFLAHIVLPDGQTAGVWLRPQIEEAYTHNLMPTELRLALPRGDA